jgi:hypothetical protein
MPLLFPIAADARAALEAEPVARIQVEAAERAGAPVSLVSDWLRPAPAEVAALQPLLDRGAASGFVQVYEDDRGRPVIAVTYWKPRRAAPDPVAASPAIPSLVETVAEPVRTARRRRRHRTADSRQLDLFLGPDQSGHETPDPHNPSVVLVEEEGVGAAFGLAGETPGAPPAAPRRRPRKR